MAGDSMATKAWVLTFFKKESNLCGKSFWEGADNSGAAGLLPLFTKNEALTIK